MKTNTEAVVLFKEIQKKTIDKLQQYAPNLLIDKTKWSYDQGDGGGLSIVCKDKDLIDQASISFSNISGKKLNPSAIIAKPELKNASFKATGVSVIVHPKNPYTPTTHANFRLFEATKTDGSIIWWFGGGFDLTPYFPFEEDCINWHKSAQKACLPFGDAIYQEFKKECDDYFYLPHRKEPRGIGGLFFDGLNRWDFNNCLSFVEAASSCFIKSYGELLEKRKNTPYSEQAELFKLYRRSRYVEFNLLYDRGTKFGLESKGRVSSILSSIPPIVHWNYKNDSYTTKQEKILLEFLHKKHWV